MVAGKDLVFRAGSLKFHVCSPTVSESMFALNVTILHLAQNHISFQSDISEMGSVRFAFFLTGHLSEITSSLVFLRLFIVFEYRRVTLNKWLSAYTAFSNLTAMCSGVCLIQL